MNARKEDYAWIAELVFVVVAVTLALLAWVVGGLGGYLVRCYRRHGHRPAMVTAAVLAELAVIPAILLAAAGWYAAAAVLGLVTLLAWTAVVALLTTHYDGLERAAARARADQTLGDVLAGRPWWAP